MNFLDLLEKQGDKVVLSEMSLIQKMLPARATLPIPACMYREIDGDTTPELDYEVFNILAWVIAKRENPDITLEQVGDRIGIGNADKLSEVVKEVWYFYTTRSREDIKLLASAESSEEDEGSETSVNPPPDLASNSS